MKTQLFLFITAIVVILAVRLVLRLIQAKVRGWIGEKAVSIILKFLPDEYTVFNNIYIEENGKSTQIDHVILSPYGIFVIETKNYSGWIYGSENAQYWTKNKYGTKYRFYNPLLQNYSHVKALQSLFGFPMLYFVPIVVFTGRATIKGHYPNHYVIYARQLLSTIKAYRKIVLKEEILTTIINKLSYSSFETSETASNHVNQIKDGIRERKAIIMQGICPRCGGTLVHRQGKYGAFWGCCNYPECHYTLNEQTLMKGGAS